jgi:hypothetical protein
LIGNVELDINYKCRQAGAKFVLCVVSGLLGLVFEDFGFEFETELHSGRFCEEIPIKALQVDSKGTWVVLLSQLDNMTYGLEQGASVKLTGLPVFDTLDTLVVKKCNFTLDEGEFLIDKKFNILPDLTGRTFAQVVFPSKTFKFVRYHPLRFSRHYKQKLTVKRYYWKNLYNLKTDLRCNHTWRW